MAFSSTIRGTCYIPPLRIIYGEWTGSSGDAAGTLAIAGGYPVAAIFQKLDPIDSTYQILPRVETSVASGICTFTIENQDTVTTGRFLVIMPSQ